VEVGDRSHPTVLFVHGSPGSWDAFIGFLGDEKLAARAHLVSVDRPGFGGSGRGHAEPSLARQAAALAQVLAADPAGLPAIVVGHSLGGPIVAQLAVDDPRSVAGLVLVAPSIDPALEEHRWFNVAASWWVVDWLLPLDMVTSNREIWPLKGELEKLLPRWSEIRVPVTVIQGTADELVSPANADFAERVLDHAPVDVQRYSGVGHLIPWQHPRLIEEAVLAQLAAGGPAAQSQ
jgi:pimeloyl-ACP methyl ester carboxylesterase